MKESVIKDPALKIIREHLVVILYTKRQKLVKVSSTQCDSTSESSKEKQLRKKNSTKAISPSQFKNPENAPN